MLGWSLFFSLPTANRFSSTTFFLSLIIYNDEWWYLWWSSFHHIIIKPRIGPKLDFFIPCSCLQLWTCLSTRLYLPLDFVFPSAQNVDRWQQFKAMLVINLYLPDIGNVIGLANIWDMQEVWSTKCSLI